MIETAKLMGICGFYFGMSFQVTHKVMPPDIVQEATAEFVDVGFHEEGLFGMPHTACAASRAWPAALHPGWKQGWVQLDRIPRWVGFRIHGEREN